MAKLEAENEELRGKVTICERKEEEKKIALCNNKPKSIETTTRIGHTIYTGETSFIFSLSRVILSTFFGTVYSSFG